MRGERLRMSGAGARLCCAWTRSRASQRVEVKRWVCAWWDFRVRAGFLVHFLFSEMFSGLFMLECWRLCDLMLEPWATVTKIKWIKMLDTFWFLCGMSLGLNVPLLNSTNKAEELQFCHFPGAQVCVWVEIFVAFGAKGYWWYKYVFMFSCRVTCSHILCSLIN